MDSDEDSDDDAMDTAAIRLYLASDKQRYLFRSYKYRVSRFNRFAEDLGEDKEEDDLPWMTDSEFLRKYRVSKESFKKLLKLIEESNVFKSNKDGRCQRPVAYQLMVFLFYIGTEGSGANNAGQRNMFAISQGVAQIYREPASYTIQLPVGGWNQIIILLQTCKPPTVSHERVYLARCRIFRRLRRRRRIRFFRHLARIPALTAIRI